jgi:hypothetical protein
VNELSCVPGGNQINFSKLFSVRLYQVHHVILLGIMSHQCQGSSHLYHLLSLYFSHHNG